eukprot:5075549-Pyramimonas_sp.AAC.1
MHSSAAEAKATAAWQEWARASFQGGAGLAHRFAKVKMEVEVPTAGSSCQPTALADAELDLWAGIWQHHQLRE